jgi:hypothetical protein
MSSLVQGPDCEEEVLVTLQKKITFVRNLKLIKKKMRDSKTGKDMPNKGEC